METKFQASFIPKQPVNVPARRTSGSNIFFLISLLILIVAIIGAGGVYFWEKKINKDIASVNESLVRARNSFDQNTVKEFSRLNDKINSSEFLLKQHVAPSVLFKVIGDVTLKNVRFVNFRYANAGGDKISISMNGEAVSYEAVALQASAFTNPKLRNVFRSPIFSDPDLGSNGRAVFTFTTGIDPILLNHYKLKTDPNNQVFQSAGLNTDGSSNTNAGVNTGANNNTGTSANKTSPVNSNNKSGASTNDGAGVDVKSGDAGAKVDQNLIEFNNQ